MIKGFSLSFWKMADLIEVEALSFLKQEITQQLIIVSHIQNRSPLAACMIDQVIDYFAVFAPVRNQCFRTLVIRLVMNVHLSHQ